MKKVITILMVAVCMLTMVACGSDIKQPNTSDIMTGIKNVSKLPEMSDVTKENVTIYIDMDVSQIEQLSFSVASSGVEGEEIFIAKMANGTDMESLKKKFEERRDAQSELFASYNPTAADLIKKAAIEVKGNYILYAVTDDSSKAKKVFLDSFK